MALVLAGLALVLVLWAVYAFNRLVRLRNQVGNAWADIDVQLVRRHDLVPQLVAAVQGYADHEQSTLQLVTQLRASAMAQHGAARVGQLETALQGAIARLLALKEAYPDLKASANFTQLQRDLVEVEEHLQFARRFYNGAVRDLNDGVQRFPDLIVARLGGFQLAEFFQADAGERQPAPVKLS